MALDPKAKAAVSGIPEGTPTPPPVDMSNMATGLSSDSPSAQQAMTDLMESRGSLRNSLRGGIGAMAAGAEAAKGALSPLAAFMQGAQAGLQAPGILFAQKRKELQETIDASPFAITHPELAGPGAPYANLGGFPTKLAVETIQQIAKDAAKVQAESAAQQAAIQKTADVGSVMTPKEIEAYSNILGPKIDITGMRKQDVIELAKLADAKGAAGAEATKFQVEMKKLFDSRPAVESYALVKDEANAIDAIDRKLATGKTLTDSEQLALSTHFKNILMAKGGGRASEETYGLLENKTWYASKAEQILSGKPVNLSPEEAKDMIAASRIKVDEIKKGYNTELSKFANHPSIKGNAQAEAFVLGQEAQPMGDVQIFIGPDKVPFRGIKQPDGSIKKVP